MGDACFETLLLAEETRLVTTLLDIADMVPHQIKNKRNFLLPCMRKIYTDKEKLCTFSSCVSQSGRIQEVGVCVISLDRGDKAARFCEHHTTFDFHQFDLHQLGFRIVGLVDEVCVNLYV